MTEMLVRPAYPRIGDDLRAGIRDGTSPLFEVEPGKRVLERQFVFYARDEPSQMSRSYLLMADVETTPVADPANEPWPGGNTAQLATLGMCHHLSGRCRMRRG